MIYHISKNNKHSTMDYKTLYEQLQMEEIEKLEQYMDWKRDGEGSLYEFIKTYLGHNDALEENARDERDLRFAAEAENEKLNRECFELGEYERIVEHMWCELYERDIEGGEIDWKTITDYDEETAKKLYEANGYLEAKSDKVN